MPPPDPIEAPIARAEELLSLRARAQGRKRFETVNDEWHLKTLRRVAPMPKEDRAAYQSAKTMNGQAETFYAQRNFPQAQPLYEKALKTFCHLLTDVHPETATGHINPSVILTDQEKYAEARSLFEEALKTFSRLLTDKHPLTAISYNSAAYNLNAQGRYTQAQPLYARALEIQRRLLGDDDPTIATGYNNTAHNLNAQGRHAEAQPLSEKALEIHRRLLADNHRDTAVSYSDLAMNLNAQEAGVGEKAQQIAATKAPK
jgi:tetratricopeptide (TPR) repeat protein